MRKWDVLKGVFIQIRISGYGSVVQYSHQQAACRTHSMEDKQTTEKKIDSKKKSEM